MHFQFLIDGKVVFDNPQAKGIIDFEVMWIKFQEYLNEKEEASPSP